MTSWKDIHYRPEKKMGKIFTIYVITRSDLSESPSL